MCVVFFVFTMAPKRKRKQQQDATQKKKKEQEPEPEPEQEEEGTKKSPGSSSDRDEVCLISPPRPNKNEDNSHSITITSSSTKKKGKKGKRISSLKAKDGNVLKETMQPIPLTTNTHITDLSKYEGVFQKLGLWEFANLDIDSDLRSDELAQLVMTYDQTAHASFVKNLRIKVSRSDLARALIIPYKKEKNSLEIPDFKAPPAYPIENCSDEAARFVLFFISSRVCPCDDPCLTTEEMVDLVESALKDEANIDWATLIWSQAEKELLQGKALEKFYYAPHFQQLIKFQRPKLFDSELVELGCEEDDSAVKTKALEDLVGVNVDNNTDMQEGGVIDYQNQGEDSQQSLENVENVSKQIDEAVLNEGVEENEDSESLRDEMEKEGDDIFESNVQPCSVNGTEIKESEEGSGHTRKLHTDSEKVDEPVRASSDDAHLVGEPTRVLSEDAHLIGEPMTVSSEDAHLAGGPVTVSSEDTHLAGGPVTISSEDTHLVGAPVTVSSEDAHPVGAPATVSSEDAHLAGPASAEHRLSEIEKGIMLNPDPNIQKATVIEHPLSEFENGTMSAPIVHLENCMSTEQFLEMGKGMMLNHAPHLENANSAGEMMSEMEKSMAMSLANDLQRSTSEDLVMTKFEKDMAVNPANYFQRHTSTEHLYPMLNQGPSQSGNTTKMEIDEDDELHGRLERKTRLEVDMPLGFGTCMENIIGYARKAEAMHENEKESIISTANARIEQLSQQLQQRDDIILSLQLGKHDERQREMEYNKLKTQFYLTNKTFYGYTRAVEEARITIEGLRETILQQNNEIKSLQQQLQQSRDFEAEFHYLKDQISHFSGHMDATYEKLTSNLEKGMQKQERLEEQLSILKVEIEKQKSESAE